MLTFICQEAPCEKCRRLKKTCRVKLSDYVVCGRCKSRRRACSFVPMVVRDGKESRLRAPFSRYRMIYWQKELRQLKAEGVEDLPTSPDVWSYEEVTEKWGARAARKKQGRQKWATEATKIVKEEINSENEDFTSTANIQSTTSVTRDSSANPARGRKPNHLPLTTLSEAATCSQSSPQPQARSRERSRSKSTKISTDTTEATSLQVSRPIKRKRSASLSATVDAVGDSRPIPTAIKSPTVTIEHACSSTASQAKRKCVRPPSPASDLLSREESRPKSYVGKSPPQRSKIVEMAAPGLNDKSKDFCILRLDRSDTYSSYRNWWTIS